MRVSGGRGVCAPGTILAQAVSMLIDDGEGTYYLSSHLDIALTIHDSFTDLDGEIYRPIGGHCSCERPGQVKSLKMAAYLALVLFHRVQVQIGDGMGYTTIADSPGILLSKRWVVRDWGGRSCSGRRCRRSGCRRPGR